MSRITESQLILPALFLMSKSNNGIISTGSLISNLTAIMRPTGTDAEILKGRNDTYFSQKVRNLKSHNTLVNKDLAINYLDGFKITDKGRDYIEMHKETIQYLLSEEFNYNDIKEAIDVVSKNERGSIISLEEIISEGRIITKSSQVRERSSRLREIAIEHFSKNNTIHCDCCGVDFYDFYGKEYGKNCIEIHHIKPIFLYKEDTFDQTVDKALKNLIPVCPNCHRIIHKNHIGSDDIDKFIKTIKKSAV